MLISCPSKTFLLGEYLALKGEPCLLVSTEPRFTLSITKAEHLQNENPFAEKSPAGMFWRKKYDFFSDKVIKFSNPSGRGGLGGSSAEFLLLYNAYLAFQGIAPEAQLQNDLMEMLKVYWKLTEEAESAGVRPSGADLVAQSCGAVTYFDRNQGKIEKTNWGFSGLGFILLATGEKVPTHEHLKNLSDWNSEELLEMNRQAYQAFRIKHEQNFIEATRKVRLALQNLGFETEKTKSLIDDLLKAPSIRAAKGCGALGADVILLLVENKDLDRVNELLKKKYTVLATNRDISEGIRVQRV